MPPRDCVKFKSSINLLLWSQNLLFLGLLHGPNWFSIINHDLMLSLCSQFPKIPTALSVTYVTFAYRQLSKEGFRLNIDRTSLKKPCSLEATGDATFTQCPFLPFPATEIHNEKFIVFICVNVMEEIERRGPVFIIKVLSSFFVGNMKPNLWEVRKIF